MARLPNMPPLFVKEVIIEPEMEDEEPLIQPVPNARRVRQAQQEEARVIIAAIEDKPPSCGFCFNTRCGAYLVAALQISYGLLQLMACLAFINFQYDDEAAPAGTGADSEIEGLDSRQAMMYNDYRVLWTGFLATFSVVSGVLTFHGLSFSKGRYLKPSILLYVVAMLTFLAQLVCILIYWDEMADKLREYLKFYCTDVESALSEELALENMKSLDVTQTQQDIKIWEQIETMITDDDMWNESTKGYLMTVMSGVCMMNVMVVSWFCWILLAQMTWMARRGQH